MNSVRVTGTEKLKDCMAEKSKMPFPKADSEVPSIQPSNPSVLPPLASWLVALLQAADSFFPTGSYAHSFGLEGLVQEGVVRDRESLRQFVFRSVLPALQHAELPLATHAWRAFGDSDWAKIEALCVLSSAMRTAREARLA